MQISFSTVTKLAAGSFIAFAALVIYLLVTATDAEANAVTLDPTQAGQTTLTVTCTYPIEREDGTPLALNEIAQVNFFVEKNGAGGFVPAGQNTTACRQVYDMSLVPDGVYVYVVTTTDTDGRESLYSPTNVTATVKRIANPKAPTGVTGLVS